VLQNLPAGNWAAGERGIGCHPIALRNSRTASTRRRLRDCARLPAGQLPRRYPAVRRDPNDAREMFIRNLQFAAPRLQAAGIKLLIEAVNTRDIPGFFLTNTSQAVDIITAVGSDNLFVQYYIYHMQIMEGDLAPTIEKHLKLIAHMQLADTPGRHEPGTGEINYDFLLGHVDKIGYQGWIGCEYKPAAKTEDGLRWTKPYLR
jgi:hydroxypyruvate isomerase